MRKLIPGAVFVLLCGASQLAAAADGTPTFTKDVAPIFYKSCVECHRATMFAPMSLTTYEDARPWRASIKQRVIGAARCRRGAPTRRTACSRTIRG